MPRVLMIGLDGFEISLAETMMREGRLPRLQRLREQGASFRLDHGEAKYSGLAWEHVSSGHSPDEGGRWSAVAFDPRTYVVSQPVTKARSFIADLPARTVAFDLPYCDLVETKNARGVSDWGAHDPGVAAASRPAELRGELEARFGAYPAREWIYGFSWPSAAKTKRLGDALERAVGVRADAARWLLGERMEDWDLGIVVVSETHSAAEALWHGVDPSHPLHAIESATASADALRRVYDATDALIGTLADAFPDAVLMVFAMHGMGANDADLPAMVLLPELLYRHAFGKPLLREQRWAATLPNGVPLLGENEDWIAALLRAVPLETAADRWRRRALRLVGRGGGKRPKNVLTWMPAARYARFWPKMEAFALPGYYDGRIRINLAGREAAGRVPPERYVAVRKEIATLIAECRDAVTGVPIAESIRLPDRDPMRLDVWDADLVVHFSGSPVGFVHPKTGADRAGPLSPPRGPYGRVGLPLSERRGDRAGSGEDGERFRRGADRHRPARRAGRTEAQRKVARFAAPCGGLAPISSPWTCESRICRNRTVNAGRGGQRA